MVAAEHVNVFFYGLFMDMGLLQQRGLAPSHPQVARLAGYDIDIREHATLICNAAARVYGMVTGLTYQGTLARCMRTLRVQDTRPEAVVVTLADARQVPAWCYNLPQVTGSPSEYGICGQTRGGGKDARVPWRLSRQTPDAGSIRASVVRLTAYSVRCTPASGTGLAPALGVIKED